MKNNVKKELISWTKTILLVLLIVFVSRQFIFSPILVQGESMMPTFETNDRVFVSKISKFKNFDMIVFRPEDKDYIKRVIGLPGDRVEMKNDALYINEEKYIEPYLSKNKENIPLEEKLTDDFTLQSLLGESKVPKGHLFVMGDNRKKSIDSRTIGFISEDSVVGKVGLRYFPLQDLGIPK